MRRDHPTSNNDERTRLYVALLLVAPYAVLVLSLPFVPNARDALAILGPFVGYAVRYLFERSTPGDNEK